MKNCEVISADFFNVSPLTVARQLLGCLLVRVLEGERLVGRIVETEAYGDLGDPACHVIARDRRIWGLLSGPPGRLYLHRSYRFALLNIVCEPPGVPGCVLVRAVEPISGLATMARLRRGAKALTNGPARLVEAFAIAEDWDSSPLPRPEFWLEADEPPSADRILNTVRIGLKRGRELPWRFAVRDNPWVSKRIRENALVEVEL